MDFDSSNELFRLAADLVNQSSRNIFLTGKAGTGKTTFLKYIRENCQKVSAVVAPTGVAAINAGGVTIHSMFQLPISPFIPVSHGFSQGDNGTDKHSLISRLRMNTEKRKVLEELELLIIDEISMVRADTLDAIDTVLRYIRSRPQELFGGVQVLFIGDMFQLPPVVRDHEWQMLSEFYASPYFFDSLVLKEEPPLCIEFRKIYRQSEEGFIRLLNQVRNNELEEDGLEILEQHYKPAFRRTANDGYIILTTHNDSARSINAERLSALDERLFSYEAEVEDDFPSNAFPGEELLQLKLGAQVMFIKNDMEKARRFYNGKIGTVTKLEDDKIFVQCGDVDDPIEVKKYKWENIRYSLNKSTRQLDEKRLGAFSQYPLRLAWAITIHKSQGLTFDKAIIDAGKSFAAGQVYVALSRCTSLDGVVLHSRINRHSLQMDPRIVEFTRSSQSPAMLEQELINSRRSYLQQLRLSLFDFNAACKTMEELTTYMVQHKNSFNAEALPWLNQLSQRLQSNQETAVRFQQQLSRLFGSAEEPLIDQRVVAGANHFNKEIGDLLKLMQQSPVATDSRLHAKEYNEQFKEAFIQLASRKHLFEMPSSLGDTRAYHERKNKFIAPFVSTNAYGGTTEKQIADTPHPALQQLLRRKRDAICENKGLPLYLVAGSQTLNEMSKYLPHTPDELARINGFGPSRIRSYGQQFLDIILEYCEEHGLESNIEERETKKTKSTTKTPRIDTKGESLKLFKSGMKIEAIAAARKLSAATIENHLAYFVSEGSLPIEELVAPDKVALITAAIKDTDENGLTAIKGRIAGDVSYGEIKFVKAAIELKQPRVD